ncbi:carboxymuconolactone decarboxylase family protein [Chloroflexi bacterium TSY]|nr:carboxymuconolactone decarboxylase family protein [Chloroflexi bacterium TSY]
MARIEPLSPEKVDPAISSMIEDAQDSLPQFMNQVLTLSHHPAIARDLVTLYLGFQEHSRVDRRLIELAVLTVSYANRCVYCVSHHAPLGLESGLSSQMLADLEGDNVMDSLHFSSLEKLVVQHAQAMTNDARRVSDALVGQLRQHLDNAQFIELTVRIGLANFFNRLNDALQIDVEGGITPLSVDRSGGGVLYYTQ